MGLDPNSKNWKNTSQSSRQHLQGGTEGGGDSTVWVHGLRIPESFRQRHPETLLGTLARGSPRHHSPPTVANNSCVFILCHQMTRKKSWLFNALVILASLPLLPGGCSHHLPSLWVPMSRTLG